jgi:hypothetical protein
MSPKLIPNLKQVLQNTELWNLLEHDCTGTFTFRYFVIAGCRFLHQETAFR